LRKTPYEELESCNVVPGRTARTGCRNSRPAAAGLGWKRRHGLLQTVLESWRAAVGPRTAPSAAGGVARPWRPLCLPVAGDGLVWQAGGSAAVLREGQGGVPDGEVEMWRSRRLFAATTVQAAAAEPCLARTGATAERKKGSDVHECRVLMTAGKEARQAGHAREATRWHRACPGCATALRHRPFLFRGPAFEITKLQKLSTNLKISKNKSCKGAIDLQLSQRVSYVLINGLSGNVGRSCLFSTALVTVHSAFN
jgi:hypothetical protein